jgi:hypothetical protein
MLQFSKRKLFILVIWEFPREYELDKIIVRGWLERRGTPLWRGAQLDAKDDDDCLRTGRAIPSLLVDISPRKIWSSRLQWLERERRAASESLMLWMRKLAAPPSPTHLTSRLRGHPGRLGHCTSSNWALQPWLESRLPRSCEAPDNCNQQKPTKLVTSQKKINLLSCRQRRR